jgi:hypothetical protein
MAGTGFCCSEGGTLLVATFQAASKNFPFLRKHALTVISESTCSLHSYKSGTLLEQRGCKPQGRFRGLRMRKRERAMLIAASESL